MAAPTSDTQPTTITGTDVLVLPRYFLLRALKEHLADLALNAELENQPDFWANLKTRLERLRHEVAEVVKGVNGGEVSDVQNDTSVRRANDVFDAQVVDFLQSVPGVPDILHSYLPKQGQSWDAFLQAKPEHERKLAVAELEVMLLQKNLPNLLLAYLDQFLVEVNDLAVLLASRSVLGSAHLKLSVSKFMPKLLGDIPTPLVKVVLLPPGSSELVRVFYATDRILLGDEYVSAVSELSPRSLSEYSGESVDDELHAVRDGVVDTPPARPLEYGYADISIPVNHHRGLVDRPLGNEVGNVHDHMIIKYMHIKWRRDGGLFFDNLDSEIVRHERGERTESGGRDVLVFIHGYNVTHEGALMVAAQLKVDMKFEGTVVAYTWSSCGTLLGYLADELNIKETVQPLKNFLLSLAAKMRVRTRIHLLAHSMGSRALIEALHQLHSGPVPPPNMNLATVTFAASDDRPLFFEEMLQAVKGAYNSRPTSAVKSGDGVGSCPPLFSVYCSRDDRALELSRALHSVTTLGEYRLGETESLFDRRWLHCPHSRKPNLDDRDVIDATGTDSHVFSIHHSYFSEVATVRQDLGVVLSKRTPAKGRSALFNVESGGVKFFAFCKEEWNPTSKL